MQRARGTGSAQGAGGTRRAGGTRGAGSTRGAGGARGARRPGLLATLLPLVLATACHAPVPVSAPGGSGEPAFLGVAYRVVSLAEYGREAEHAYRVDRVVPDSAALEAGLREGDLILRYDGRGVRRETGTRAFQEYLREYKREGDPLQLQLLRDETLWKGRRGSRALEVQNRQQMLQLLDQQGPQQNLSFRVQRRLRSLSLAVRLGRRSTLASIPDNETLFPRYQELRHPTQGLGQTLFAEHELEEAYQLWSEQQDRDERWDDGRRLPLVRYLRRDPLKMLPVVEQHSERLRAQLQDGALTPALAGLARHWRGQAPPAVPELPDGEFSLDTLRLLLNRAQQTREQALAALDEEQRDFVRREAPQLLDRLAHSYDVDHGQGAAVQRRHRRLLELGEAVDRELLLQSLLWLSLAAAPESLRALAAEWNARPVLEKNPPGVQGPVLYSGDSTAGRIVIGGAGDNRYSGDFALILDLGGDDLYRGRAGGAARGLSLVIDIRGDDEYSATDDFHQAGSILGNSVLIDLAGDDVYRSRDLGQASAVFGGGVLFDLAGDDRYSGGRFVQGSALFGVALLADFAGDDEYAAALFGQGVGLTQGVGALADLGGDDYYRCGGRYQSSYRTPGVFRGSGQGLGIGFRHRASGGVGILLEGGGEDQLEAGNFAQGTGYFFGLGVLRSFGNDNDLYRGARYGQGSAAHSALGIMLEDGGDDRYLSTFGGVILGAAWDLAAAIFEDRAGDDRYGRQPLRFSVGSAAHTGFALFSDRGGRDVYYVDGINNVWDAGSEEKINLGLFLDTGGDRDRYEGATSGRNNTSRRGGKRYGHSLWHDR